MALHRDAYGRLWRDCETCDGTGVRTIERDVFRGDYVEAVEYEVSCVDCESEHDHRVPVFCGDCGRPAVNATGPTCYTCGMEE